MPTKSPMRRNRTSIAGTKAKRKYRKVSCHTTKTVAKKKAVSLRNSGSTATVRKTKGGYCVYSAGKKK